MVNLTSITLKYQTVYVTLMADENQEQEIGLLYQLHGDKKGNFALYLDGQRLLESENGRGPYQYILSQKKFPEAKTKTDQKKLLKEWTGEVEEADQLPS